MSFVAGAAIDSSASVARRKSTLCGDCACRWAPAVVPCEFVLLAENPLSRSCVSKRSCYGAVRICLELGKPAAEIARVEALSLWRNANLSLTLCKDPACRSALAVVPCEFVLLSVNPLRRSCVSCKALSMWRCANLS